MVVRGPIASLSRLAIKREEQARTIVLRVAATPSAVFSHALTSVKNTESPVWPHPPPTPFDKIYRKVCWAAGASRRLTDRLPEPNLLTARNRLANHQELEVLLYDDVPPDTKDSNGNSLLLLASQQVRSFFYVASVSHAPSKADGRGYPVHRYYPSRLRGLGLVWQKTENGISPFFGFVWALS